MRARSRARIPPRTYFRGGSPRAAAEQRETGTRCTHDVEAIGENAHTHRELLRMGALTEVEARMAIVSQRQNLHECHTEVRLIHSHVGCF
jgi:hypothetical protein